VSFSYTYFVNLFYKFTIEYLTNLVVNLHTSCTEIVKMYTRMETNISLIK
jgi:hypothetical protein